MAEPTCVPGFVGNDPDDKFRYESYLSHGASGAAWRVVRNSDNAVLCLKVTQLDALSPEERLRTETEVACLESVNHFACIRLYDKHRTDKYLFIVMEYCDAGDLRYQLTPLRNEVERRERRRLANNEGPTTASGGGPVSQCGMEEHQVRFIFVQLALSLHYVHVHKKILHRDLKPANVLLTTNGLVKVGDFGLSNVYDTISGDVGRTICGTPAYVAPELWLRRRYGRAADMWSLGCVMYECMTGNPPFAGARLESLQSNVLTTEPPVITGPYSDLLKESVMSLLVKDPLRRPDTVALLRHPYLQSTLNELPGVLEASHISRELMVKIQSDIERQFEQVPTEKVDSTVTFEGEVEKFKPPQDFQRRYLTLAAGVLTIHKSKRAAAAWAANGGGRIDSTSIDEENCSVNSLHSRSSSASDAPGRTTASDTSHGSPTIDNKSTSMTNKSAIHVTRMENVQCIEGGFLALRFTDHNFLFFRTPQASMWERVLSLAKGKAHSSVRRDRGS